MPLRYSHSHIWSIFCPGYRHQVLEVGCCPAGATRSRIHSTVLQNILTHYHKTHDPLVSLDRCEERADFRVRSRGDKQVKTTPPKLFPPLETSHWKQEGADAEIDESHFLEVCFTKTWLCKKSNNEMDIRSPASSYPSVGRLISSLSDTDQLNRLLALRNSSLCRNHSLMVSSFEHHALAQA